MSSTPLGLIQYHELVWALARKHIFTRYKQAYFGVIWAVAKPLVMMLIFMLLRSFIGIESGNTPYALLSFCALLPWILFQESASEGVNSIVANSVLIRKIYFPRELFPIIAVFTKVIEFAINFAILLLMMALYDHAPTLTLLWTPLILLYTVLVALTIAFAGSALNVYYRDVSSAMPVVLSLMMYLSPIIYPLALVEKKLTVEHIAGEHSELLFQLYLANPVAGIIDSFQRAMLLNLPPDPSHVLPGMVLVGILLPVSYVIFKRAEAYFADIV